jgi:5'-deoxynucleotidase YfbR-like HD superfamily hydrolase
MQEPGLGKFLKDTSTRMEKSKKFRPGSKKSCESILMHTLEMAFLGKIMLEIESVQGKKLDAYKVLSSIIIRDIIQLSIIGVPEELSQQVIDKIKRDEKKELEKILKSLPPEASLRFKERYGLQYDRETPEGRFFEAVELLGNMIFEVRDHLNGKAKITGLFETNHERILKLSKEFKSLEILYNPYRRIAEKLIN